MLSVAAFTSIQSLDPARPGRQKAGQEGGRGALHMDWLITVSHCSIVWCVPLTARTGTMTRCRLAA